MTKIKVSPTCGAYFATSEHPSSDGCFATYWGCEISTPKLSMDGLIDIFGQDDCGTTIIGGYGRLRKLSCRWFMGLDHTTHFQVLCNQLPNVTELQSLKNKYELKIEFYRFWYGRTNNLVPVIDDNIFSIIQDYGGEFEDVIQINDGNHKSVYAGVSFIIRGTTINFADLSRFFGSSTREIKPTDRIGRPGWRTSRAPRSEVTNLTKNRAVWIVDSAKLIDSNSWRDVLWSVFDYLKPPPAEWPSYLQENHLSVEFSAIWSGDEGATEPVLTTEEFNLICAYNATWNLTPIYADGHDFGWY